MAMGPATADQLLAVRAAQDEFRVYWESIRPLFPCAFEGSGIDVDALDYLDYEGLRYPSCGQAGASLVWGNVIATQMPFRWFFDEDLGSLMLRSQEKGLTIWPFGRVYESQRSAERNSTNTGGSSSGSSCNPWGFNSWEMKTGPECSRWSAVTSGVRAIRRARNGATT